jgi:peroxiredoxin Q/BCP
MKLSPGMQAPDFALADETGTLRKLSDFAGKKLILYFYPKDSTPGCTQEACSLRDSYEAFGKREIAIVGISYDSPESHAKFKHKYNLPFTLLSDSAQQTAKVYGAYQSIKNYLFPERITFIINEMGIITHILEDIDVANHGEEILALID